MYTEEEHDVSNTFLMPFKPLTLALSFKKKTNSPKEPI